MPRIAEVTRKTKDPAFTDEQIDAVLELLDQTLYPQVVTVDDVELDTQSKARSRAAQMRVLLVEDGVTVRATCVPSDDGTKYLGAVGYPKSHVAPVAEPATEPAANGKAKS